MLAFGREARLPGALLSDPDNPELHSRIDKDTDLQNIMEITANAYRPIGHASILSTTPIFGELCCVQAAHGKVHGK